MNKVLIVENEKGIRDNLKIILEMHGYKVKQTSDGIKALSELEHFEPDLILSDIMMPNLNGVELYKIVREKYNYNYIPFIFLTAKNDHQSLREGMQLGVEDYITKPFDMEDLIKSIKVRIEKKTKLEKQSNLIKENIIKYVPHELRTPLMPIINMSEFLLTETDNLDQNEIKEIAGQINFAGHRLLNRLKKFLIYTEVETLDENSDVFSSVTEINEDFVLNVVYENQALRKTRALINLSVIPAVLCIHNYYLSILINELVENAFKFSNGGTKIKINGNTVGDKYNLGITNLGCGMSEDEIAGISSFRQFKREIHNKNGNGLGLAIVKEIVKLFRGELFFENEENKYLTVRIFLPSRCSKKNGSMKLTTIDKTQTA